MEFIRCLFPLIPFLILSLVFVASYTTLPAIKAGPNTTPLGSSVDKNCREQLLLYFLDHAVEIVNIFGWLWIRFYIASGVVRLVMDEIAKLIEDTELFAGIGSQLTTPNEETPVVETQQPAI
ncbi:hypothetical protein N7537_002183 [Penicillium hordei]|uniref:Uncharacterized protein n=1 Tax=Penicillium hordei TaxID=40994 RepID=A0AAD6H959_9EURO|nr:uncharacterized protein N7537_002183 [Penicillium hordei]KAJ5617069.1 hypothetical protein N7537_002183 [Penicillium hordei]